MFMGDPKWQPTATEIRDFVQRLSSFHDDLPENEHLFLDVLVGAAVSSGGDVQGFAGLETLLEAATVEAASHGDHVCYFSG